MFSLSLSGRFEIYAINPAGDRFELHLRPMDDGAALVDVHRITLARDDFEAWFGRPELGAALGAQVEMVIR